MICITCPVEGVLPEWFTTRLYFLVLTMASMFEPTAAYYGGEDFEVIYV